MVTLKLSVDIQYMYINQIFFAVVSLISSYIGECYQLNREAVAKLVLRLCVCVCACVCPSAMIKKVA